MGFGFSLKDVENRILADFMEEGEELRKQLRFNSPSSSNLPSRTIPSDLTKLPLHRKAVHPHLVRAATSALNKLHLQSMLFKFRAFYPQVSKTLFPVWCWVLLPRTCPYTCCCICLCILQHSLRLLGFWGPQILWALWYIAPSWVLLNVLPFLCAIAHILIPAVSTSLATNSSYSVSDLNTKPVFSTFFFCNSIYPSHLTGLSFSVLVHLC